MEERDSSYDTSFTSTTSRDTSRNSQAPLVDNLGRESSVLRVTTVREDRRVAASMSDSRRICYC